jgi:hypothetical protein
MHAPRWRDPLEPRARIVHTFRAKICHSGVWNVFLQVGIPSWENPLSALICEDFVPNLSHSCRLWGSGGGGNRTSRLYQALILITLAISVLTALS